jgi:nitrogen regulatory protein P-II 1
MKMIMAVIKPEKLDEVKNALNEKNIKGITITQVIGAGNQKGQKQFYRGAEVGINLLPKIKLEIGVHDDQVDELIKVIMKPLTPAALATVKYSSIHWIMPTGLELVKMETLRFNH